MLAERLVAAERMDDPALDAGTYRAVLADLARVNRVTLAYRPTLAFLARALGTRKRFTLLDVGFGDGDMLRRIARWADRRGIDAQLTGVDLNPGSQAAAEAHGSAGGRIRYLTGDYAELAGGGFDFVVSSLVAHHMTRTELMAFLAFMEREAGQGWLVNDLHRHGLAWLGFPALARIMGWHPIVRHDGAVSIARSYRPGEWTAILTAAGMKGAKIERWFPFRLCVHKIR